MHECRGSAIAKVVGENAARQPELFQPLVKMYGGTSVRLVQVSYFVTTAGGCTKRSSKAES